MPRACTVQSEYSFDDLPVGRTQLQIYPRKPLSELNQVHEYLETYFRERLGNNDLHGDTDIDSI